jgi:hypothetical protein
MHGRQIQIDEIPDGYDPGITELPQTEQVLVFADDEVRFGDCSAFENAVVGGIFLNDVQYFGWGNMITEGEQLAARVLKRIAIPLELVAKHADRLGHYRVRNVDADISGPRVADDYGRRATEMQRPDIDAGIERGAGHCLVRLNGCAAQRGIRQSDGRRQTL